MSRKQAWRKYRRLAAAAPKDPQRAEAELRRLVAQGIDDRQLAALCHNDLGVLAGARGDADAAHQEFSAALAADPECEAARINMERLEHPQPLAADTAGPVAPLSAAAPTPAPAVVTLPAPAPSPVAARAASGKKVALVSLLFNWPSSGGGIHDTLGIGRGLQEAGIEVRHFYISYAQAGIGNVTAPSPLPSIPISFDNEPLSAQLVKQRLAAAVSQFGPDGVLITDSWNFKPHLLEALADVRCLARFHAAECLCPLNNIRYLPRPDGDSICHRHFLATPNQCLECLRGNRSVSGPLHTWERALSGVEAAGFHDFLCAQLERAAALAVNNPLIAAILAPYARNTRVITSGVDTQALYVGEPADGEMKTILMAGVVEEPMKGFAVLRQACQILRQQRQDFRVLVTANTVGQVDEWTWSVGWQAPERLPELYAQADICVVPSVCEEAFGIVAAEAMAAGRPVVASRIGGLQFTVLDEVTGLLFEPGNAHELAQQLERLLDDADLRHLLGAAARQRAVRYDWRNIIADHYLPMLAG